MNLRDNAFYILGASAQDNRKRITSLYDEKCLLTQDDRFSEAHRSLLIPNKRLIEEMGWLPGISSSDIDIISKYIQQDEIIPLLGKNIIAYINISKWNYQHRTSYDLKQLEIDIVHMDTVFSEMKVNQVKELINSDRKIARFPLIESDVVIKQEIRSFRNALKTTILEVLKELDGRSYIQLINTLCEQYVVALEYKHGAVIDDIIADYEIAMTQKSGDYIKEVKRYMREIRTPVVADDSYEIRVRVNEMIDMVNEWGMVSKTLRIILQLRGVEYKQNIRMATMLQAISFYIRNKLGYPDVALILLRSVKGVFAEDSEDFEIIAEEIERIETYKKSEAQTFSPRETNMKQQGSSVRTFFMIAGIILFIIIIAFNKTPNSKSSDEYKMPSDFELPTRTKSWTMPPIPTAKWTIRPLPTSNRTFPPIPTVSIPRLPSCKPIDLDDFD